MKPTTLLLLLALIAGCNSQGTPSVDELAALVGKSIADARSELGPPSSVFDMQDGTLEYIWKEQSGGASSAGVMGVRVASGNPKSCNRVLITNEAKIIQAFRYEGTCRR